MKQLRFVVGLLLAAPWLPGCDGQQYVSPDTVALSITKDSTGSERLNECNFVPVLLGSEVDVTYDVDGDFQATIDITRDAIKVAFAGQASPVEPFVVTAKAVQDAPQAAENPPSGYTVKLSPGCTVDAP